MQFDVEAKEMGEKHWLPKASNGSLETSKSSTPKNGELELYKFVKILGSTSTLVKWAKSTNSNSYKYMSNPSSNHKISSFTNLQREGVHGATWLDPNLEASTSKEGLSWLNKNSRTT